MAGFQLNSTLGGSGNAPFSFGGFGAKTTAPAGFTLSQPAATTSTGFGLGQAATISTTGFSLSQPAATTTTGYALGQPATTSLAFGMGQPATTSTGFPLAQPATTNTTGFGLSQPATTNTTGFGLIQPQVTSSTQGFGFGLPPTTSASSQPATTSAGFSFGGVPTSTPALGQLTTSALSAGLPTLTPATTTSALASSLSLKTPSSTTATSFTLGSTATTTALSTSTTTQASTGTPMNYRQLEEALNRYHGELEEQEKIFLSQATQVNAWDRLLLDNGDKISQLNSDVERVKLEQTRLEQELDFIASQHRELEGLLVPLESAVQNLQPGNSHADRERQQTYNLAQNVDAQLKRMAQDLKEIVDRVNAVNLAQDTNDPVIQIAKILNAHMDSLQWVDQNTALLQRRVDQVAVAADERRRDQERTRYLAYD